MANVYLGVGSNIEPEKYLRLAIHELNRRFNVTRRSSVYRSQSVGFDGADFLNLVVQIQTALPPADVLENIEKIHALCGRKRDDGRYSSRELDIDLLLYDQLIVDKDKLRLPRGDILRYGFVLLPLAEIAPDLVHPVTGRTIAAHRADFDFRCQPLTIIDVIL